MQSHSGIYNSTFFCFVFNRRNTIKLQLSILSTLIFSLHLRKSFQR